MDNNTRSHRKRARLTALVAVVVASMIVFGASGPAAARQSDAAGTLDLIGTGVTQPFQCNGLNTIAITGQSHDRTLELRMQALNIATRTTTEFDPTNGPGPFTFPVATLQGTLANGFYLVTYEVVDTASGDASELVDIPIAIDTSDCRSFELGSPGRQGAPGPAGANGATGPQGASGLRGGDGATGLQGATGPAGSTGATGLQGATGPAGADGATGPQGAPGLDGATGAPGANGQQGIAGATGVAGVNGTVGASGTAGAIGADGNDGADGQNGADGADGAPGVDGLDGADGARGLDGLDGQTGQTGQTGADGADGADGAEGARGQDGPIGPAGADGVDGADGATSTLIVDGSTVTHTDGNGTAVTFDVVEIVADNSSDALVANADGSFTHTAIDGTAVEVPAPLPASSLVVFGSEITHTDGNGRAVTFDVVEIVADNGSDTFVANADGSFTHTALDGTVTVIPAP